MTPEQAKARFTEALQGSLSAREQASFDAALDADPALAREFEAFADGHAAGLADVNRWLARAAGSQPEPDSAVYAHRMVRILEGVGEGAGSRKRGRLIRVAAAIGAVAAAAAIVAVLMLPRDAGNGTVPTQQEWHTGSSVELMADGQRLYRETVNEFTPAEGITLNLSQGALVQPLAGGLRLAGGRVKVRVAEGSEYQVFIGASRIEAKGPAEFDVSTTPLLFDTISHLNPEQNPMFNTRMAARFGATGFLFTVSMLSGNAALHAEGAKQQLAAPQVLQAEAKPDKPHKAPKPEEAFEHLDKNSDGKLDATEVEQKLIDDFDDDKSGDVDLAEFQAHFKPMPPKAPTAEDEFKRLDKNGDGKLDAEETDDRMLEDFDDDSSGDVNLDEFKAHFRPRRQPPSPEDEFKRLDKNADGKLDAEEAEKRMIDDFDDDSSGDVSLEEFKKNFRPGPKPPTPEEEFKRLDRNSDGKLDDVEVEKRMLDDFDDDDNGTIDEAEFKKHFKPRPPRGPGPGGEGPGREGPGREGPGREAPGREGERPPRGPEGERPEGPGRGNRPGPR